MNALSRFQNLPFMVSTVDGRNFALIHDVYFVAADGTKYCLPAVAGESDGASTPPELWPIIPPFGKYWPAAYLHDCAYRNTLLMANGLTWARANLPKEKCDALFLEAMDSLGVNTVEAQAIYEAVVLGGTNSFNQDRGINS